MARTTVKEVGKVIVDSSRIETKLTPELIPPIAVR
jgi:hypothetical protein